MPRLAVDEDRVLVVRADHARMGQARDVQWHGLGHAVEDAGQDGNVEV